MTCQANKRVMVLLMETDHMSCNLVLERIAQTWEKNGYGYEFTHEVAVLSDEE